MIPTCVITLALTAAVPDGCVAVLGGGQFSRPWGVNDFAFSPDGRTVALIGNREGPCLFDVKTGKPIDPPDAEWNGEGSGVRFSPDGRELTLFNTVGSRQITLKFDTATGRRVGQFNATHLFAVSENETVGLRCWTPFMILTDPHVELVGLPGGTQIGPQLNPEKEREEYTLSPDGARVAVGDRFGNVRTIDGKTGWFISQTSGKDPDVSFNPVNALAWSPSGDRVAWTARDGGLRIWDGRSREHRTLWRGKAALGALAFSPDGKRIAFDDAAGRLRVIDAQSGRVRACRQVTPATPRMSLRRLRFSPDGRTIGSLLDDRLRLFDAGDGRELTPRPGHTGVVESVTFSPDGGRLTSRCWRGVVQVWDLDERRVVTRRRYPGFGISPDGTRALGWDQQYGFSLNPLRSEKPVSLEPVTTDGPTGHDFSPDGQLVCVTCMEGHAAVWNAATGEAVAVHDLTPHRWLTGLHRSPDGTITGLLIHDEAPHGIDLLDLASGRKLATFPLTQRPTDAVRSPDGGLIAVRIWEGHELILRFWQPANGLRWRTATGDLGRPVISPDAAVIAGTGGNGEIVLIEAHSGREVNRFRGPAGVRTLAFSPDGRLVAAGTEDTTIRLWDAVGDPPDGTPDELWERLGGDAGTAHAAIWALVDRPEVAVKLTADRLKPEPPIDGDTVSSLIADLGSPRFAKRESAQRELTALGPGAIPMVEAALDDPRTSAEANRRLDAVLWTLRKSPASPWQLKARRAISVLERIDSPESRVLLRRFTDGNLGEWAATEAEAALIRMTLHHQERE